MKKHLLTKLLPLLLAILFCVGCQTQPLDFTPSGSVSDTLTQATSPADELSPSERQARLLNDVSLDQYCLVYCDEDIDYSYRAAQYIQSEVEARTGVKLAIKEDHDATQAHEIVVGETSRKISKELDADTEHTQFAILADGEKIALEGDYFVIAAAAYFFVETYVPDAYFDSSIPKQTTVHEPIQKEAENFIFLIGDGMGLYQTLLYDVYDVPTSGSYAYSDGEDLFYGYLLPHQGYACTNSLSGVTDSAAAGTALATGYKTVNGYVGKNQSKKDVLSLTELAASMGKATAVMSTEPSTGATPASFSAHANDRNDSTDILASQQKLTQSFGTVIRCDFNKYDVADVKQVQTTINQTLNELSENGDGFFLMYEEAHIDKHCHNNDMTNTFRALVRFNQAIGVFMEYAFYHPETFVLITADHETGGLLPNASGTYSYSHSNHSAHYVPVFAYGMLADVFDGCVVENTQIPKTIAHMMGKENFGADDQYKSLLP